MKKITSLALVMIMVLTTLTVGTLFASATLANSARSGDTLTFSGGTDASKPTNLTEEDLNAITKVVFSDDITTVNSDALAGLRNNLDSVRFGKNVAKISEKAFGSGDSLTAVTSFEVDSENKNFAVISSGKYLVNKEETEIIRAASGSGMPTADDSSKITKIGDYAFENSGLTGSLSIPDNIRVIGEYAFAKNNITSIEKLGAQLNTIEKGAFSDCSALASISRIDNPVLSVGADAFKGASLTVDIFNGTDSEWNAVSANDSVLKNAVVSAKNNSTEWVVYDSISKDGTLGSNPLNVEYTNGITVTTETPISINGRSFLGWATNPSSATAVYKAGDAISLDGSISIRLYAVFSSSTAEYWELTFDANGGKLSNTLANGVSVEKGRSYSFSATGAESDLYDLLGWATKKDAEKAEYEIGSSFTPTANTTLYAVWNTKYLTVKFRGNDDANDVATNVPETKEKIESGTSVEVDNPSRVASTDSTLERYKFLGWAKTSDATKPDYAAGETSTKITNITTNLTLYAVWEGLGPWDVKFYSNWDFSEDSEFYMKDASFTNDKGNAIKNGETFVVPDYPSMGDLLCDCWLSDNGLLQYKPGDIVTVYRHLTLYPNWNHSISNIIYNTATINLSGNISETVAYRTKVTIYAEIDNVNDSSDQLILAIYRGRDLVDFKPVLSGKESLTVETEELTKDTSFTVKLLKKDDSQADYYKVVNNFYGPMVSKIDIKVKTDIFSKIIAFFKSIFNILPTKTIGASMS